MSPPTEAQQLSGLASLAGEEPPKLATLPQDALGKALLTLRLIGEAKARGASWATIAPLVGATDGKAAKAAAKRLARKTQAAVIRRDLAEQGKMGP